LEIKELFETGIEVRLLKFYYIEAKNICI